MAKARLKTFGHLLAGFVIILHGWGAYEKGHRTSWMFLLLGILFLFIAIYHKQLVKRFPKIDGIMFLIEALALFATSYDYFHEHKKYLQWVILLSAIMYFVLGMLILSGVKKTRDHP